MIWVHHSKVLNQLLLARFLALARCLSGKSGDRSDPLLDLLAVAALVHQQRIFGLGVVGALGVGSGALGAYRLQPQLVKTWWRLWQPRLATRPPFPASLGQWRPATTADLPPGQWMRTWPFC